jgi:hypothetical protein
MLLAKVISGAMNLPGMCAGLSGQQMVQRLIGTTCSSNTDTAPVAVVRLGILQNLIC